MSLRRSGSMPRHILLRRNRTNRAGCSHLSPFSCQATSDDPFPEDFNDTALGRELTARWGDINQTTRAPHRVMATTMSMRDALEDARWRGHVLKMMVGAAKGVEGTGPQLQCFTCCKPWTMARSPPAVVIVELMPLERALIAGVCQRCTGRSDLRAKVFAGLRRDIWLDPATVRTVHEGTRA